VRHPDARRFAQSGAAENDRHSTRELSEAHGDHVRGDPQRAVGRCERVIAAAYVNQERPVGD
jgi:hypothetical protein